MTAHFRQVAMTTIAQTIEKLRNAGAPKFDPLAWHYIQVLEQKSQGYDGLTHELLNQKLEDSLQQLEQRMLNVHSPKLANPEHHLLAQSPLSQLIQDWPSTPSNLALSHDSSQHQESSRFKEFRKALSTLTVQKQISRAITQAPQNAGPINSHMLILRSLGLMHELSPDYLNRFMAYIDTLFCLEDAGKAKLQLSKIPAKPKDQ